MHYHQNFVDVWSRLRPVQSTVLLLARSGVVSVLVKFLWHPYQRFQWETNVFQLWSTSNPEVRCGAGIIAMPHPDSDAFVARVRSSDPASQT